MTGVSRRVILSGLAVAALAAWPLASAQAPRAAARKPNIVLILADDLGYAEIGSYGQTKIHTPNLDALARAGVRFTQHYSGSPVCAPSRDVLLTGLHTGHAYIRDNDEMGERGDVWHDLALEGQRPILPGTVTLATVLKQAGYATAAVGKWGLGGPASTGEPNRHGFDLFFGYLCQRVAHNYYPAYLWRNTTKVPLDNPGIYPHEKLPAGLDPDDPASYARYGGKQYSLDLMGEEARSFIRSNKDRPFLLYFAPTAPHVSLQVPEDSLKEYAGVLPDAPYLGNKSYLPNRTPHATYAAMVTRLDREVGRIIATLRELGLERDTLVVFTSDNGPTIDVGGADSKFFDSARPFRGLKTMLYEGGIRVPMLAAWPGRIPAGTTSDYPSAFQDYLPTFASVAGVAPPKDVDGVSLLAAMEGRTAAVPAREYLYWEFSGRQAVRTGDWKAVRTAATGAFELHNLRSNVGEQQNVATANPAVVSRIESIMKTARTESALFPLVKPAAVK